MGDPRTSVSFFVVGDPIPQGSMKTVNRRTFADNADQLYPWRDNIAASVMQQVWVPGQAGPVFPKRHPVQVSACFTVKAPKNVRKTILNYPAVPADLDKLVRALFDGITQAKRGGHRVLWQDDAQAVSFGHVSKTYPKGVLGANEFASARPGVKVLVRSVI